MPQSAGPNRADPVSGAALRGSSWTVALQWSYRLIGFFSLTVTARLLTPEDFGLAGTAAIALTFFDILSHLGTHSYLIKAETLTSRQILSAWSIGAVQRLAVAAVLLLLAEPLAHLLNDPAVAPVLRVYALIPFLDAFAAPAQALLTRDMRFGKLFVLRLVPRVLATAATIALAFAWQSYWALVAGAVLAQAAFTVMTVILLRFRPAFDFSHGREILGFSGVMLMRSIAGFLSNQGHSLVVRTSLPTALFGSYKVAADLAMLLVGEILQPLAAPALPSAARLRNDPDRLAEALTISEGLVLHLAVALGAGLALVAPEAVRLLLGDQWTQSGPLVALMAPGIAALGVSQIRSAIGVALNAHRLVAWAWLLQAATVAGACAIALPLGGPQAVAGCFSAGMILFGLLGLAAMNRLLARPVRLAPLAVRPLLAGAAMTAALTALPLGPQLPAAAALAAKVGVGAAVYAAATLIAWRLAGRPRGPERFVLDNLKAARRRRP